MAMVDAARATWPTETTEWIEIDRQLRSNKRQLDAHEMYWLREAERVQIWRPLGMVSMLDYMDRVLGQNPETARKRLRVARALADLPEISAALAANELSFCMVRELTRVATSATERAWCAAAKTKTSREIEDLGNGARRTRHDAAQRRRNRAPSTAHRQPRSRELAANGRGRRTVCARLEARDCSRSCRRGDGPRGP